MDIVLGKMDVPLTYDELNSLILTKVESLPDWMSSPHLDWKEQLNRINFLVAKLKEFERLAEQNNG